MKTGGQNWPDTLKTHVGPELLSTPETAISRKHMKQCWRTQT